MHPITFGQLRRSLGLLSGAAILEQPWGSVGGQCQLSELVSRIWVNSQEPCPGFDFLSLASLGLLIRVCSRSHLVLDLAEMRGPRGESEQVERGGASCLCPSQRP